jgi:hypothetical protein
MQHEGLLVSTFKAVDHLLVFPRSKRGDDQRLRLTAGEQRRTVRARQEPNLAGDWSDG